MTDYRALDHDGLRKAIAQRQGWRAVENTPTLPYKVVNAEGQWAGAGMTEQSAWESALAFPEDSYIPNYPADLNAALALPVPAGYYWEIRPDIPRVWLISELEDVIAGTRGTNLAEGVCICWLELEP